MSDGFKYSEKRFAELANIVDSMNMLVATFINDYNNVILQLNSVVIGWIEQDKAALESAESADEFLSAYDESGRSE